VLAAVTHVVEQLNDVADDYGLIETDGREQLCAYIDAVLTNAGVDIDALAERRGISRDLTDPAGRTW
jgi:hypothetical protein